MMQPAGMPNSTTSSGSGGTSCGSTQNAHAMMPMDSSMIAVNNPAPTSAPLTRSAFRSVCSMFTKLTPCSSFAVRRASVCSTSSSLRLTGSFLKQSAEVHCLVQIGAAGIQALQLAGHSLSQRTLSLQHLPDLGQRHIQFAQQFDAPQTLDIRLRVTAVAVAGLPPGADKPLLLIKADILFWSRLRRLPPR